MSHFFEMQYNNVVNHKEFNLLIGNHCISSIVESTIEYWNSDIIRIANQLNLAPEVVEKRVRLHLPNLSIDILNKSQSIPMPLFFEKNIINTLENYKHFYDLYLRESGGFKLLNIESKIISRDEGYILLNTGERIAIFFKEVGSEIGNLIESKLHYLMSPRPDASIRYGLFIRGFDFPICYMSFAEIDRFYSTHTLSSCLNQPIANKEMVNLTRVYGFGNLPNNTISKVISECSCIFKKKNYNYLTTAINPLIGFSGTSMFASGFKPFALCPVSYVYDKDGKYVTRRNNEDLECEGEKWSTPPNVLMVKSMNSKANKKIKLLTKIYKISQQTYLRVNEFENINHQKMNEDKVSLTDVRAELEKAWNSITRYHGTAWYENDPISKGQCGVTTAYLAREFESNGYKPLFCNGNVEFADGIMGINNHCWLRIPRYEHEGKVFVDLIVDLTADQSGFPEPVICDTLENLKKKGINYIQTQQLPPRKVETGDLRKRLTYLEGQLKNLSEPV